MPRGILREDLAENNVAQRSPQVETFYDGDKEVLSSALKALARLVTVLFQRDSGSRNPCVRSMGVLLFTIHETFTNRVHRERVVAGPAGVV